MRCGRCILKRNKHESKEQPLHGTKYSRDSVNYVLSIHCQSYRRTWPLSNRVFVHNKRKQDKGGVETASAPTNRVTSYRYRRDCMASFFPSISIRRRSSCFALDRSVARDRSCSAHSCFRTLTFSEDMPLASFTTLRGA